MDVNRKTVKLQLNSIIELVALI